MSATNLVTTGLVPLVVGASKIFELSPFLDFLPADLTGCTVTLLMQDPTGLPYNYPATITAGVATYGWTVLGPVGNWTRAWKVVDPSGAVSIGDPIIFTVGVSP